jgi:nucleoside-diphosphate-sugar epimerase
VVSGQAEQDLDIGLKVNLDGTRNVLEGLRTGGRVPLLVFTSSVAAYGGDLPETITDTTPLTPATSYGVQKVACELLIMDYTRRGLIDGRSVRLPTVSVRPGKPNKAASGFASGIAREPLSGIAFVCPVTPESQMAILSPRKAVAALRWAAGLASDRLGHDRSILLPGITVSMAEMVEAVRRAGGDDAAKLISFDQDPAIQRIVDGWPRAIDARRAAALGFEGDRNIDDVLAAFVEDDLPRQ